ncbi:type VII secretion protein EccB [Streptomyces fuscigenes]|uniref:type VII secretion protein EccB n=1 Tax=Streptomyces fuscigenes TaxID=1528880 RepID=UPI001F3A702D|nr:type VII secretion protein EccB [Streptomyces fuscigenes]MCF3961380.1 type VII secretion protein EccB [Streptomyces fuscigenes]
MASRRDELNAYTFAKKRTVASFLQPSPTGTEEGAPRPMRAVLPSLVVGALVLAGFGALGMFKPSAPKDWDKAGANVIVGKQSTTRYVVLSTGKGKSRQTLLHPVLNLASARLLLDPDQFSVIQVDDKILDGGKPARGAILGIPYAPDRLPSDTEAGAPKRWAVCEQPGGGEGGSVQKAAFVFARRDFHRTEGTGRLAGGQVLYVKGQDGARYLVSADGTKYLLKGRQDDKLTRALIGADRDPQPVTDDWLATLHTGTPLDFPAVPGQVGSDAGVGGGLTPQQDRVGMVLSAQTGAGPQQYVVLPGRVEPVSDFTAWLLINSPQNLALTMHGEAASVDLASINPDSGFFAGDNHWPKERVGQVNTTGAAGTRDTVCSVLRATGASGSTTVSTWAGPEYPAQIPEGGGTSTYVTPGSGLLYDETQGSQAKAGGSMFLVTDTGLRYAVQSNGDSDSKRSDIGAGDDQKTEDGRPQPSQAQIRLGYEKVIPVPVPIAWSAFLSKGPRLDTNSARQPQGS